MKKLSTLILLMMFSMAVSAQLEVPITFEEGFADTSWNIFANGAEGVPEDISVVINPWASDINASDSVLQFIVRDDSDPWVGMYTDNVGIMYFPDTAYTFSMMAYKSVISPLRIKLEQSMNSGPDYSVTVENTITDDWELLVFEMTDAVGFYYTRLTIFPDFPETRDGGSTVYLDNIQNFVEETSNPTSIRQFSEGQLRIYPNPVKNRLGIQFPEMKGLKVMDILGKTLKTFEFQPVNSKVIDLSDLQAGYYFIHVDANSGSYSAPFIKK